MLSSPFRISSLLLYYQKMAMVLFSLVMISTDDEVSYIALKYNSFPFLGFLLLLAFRVEDMFH